MRALPIQAREQERPAAGFGLNPDLDVEGLAAAYAATGRVRIHRFLAEQGLPEFYDNLCERDDWWHLMNGPDGIVEIDRATRAGISEADRRRLDDMVDAGARTGFQYRYEGLRVPEGQADPAMGTDPLDTFADLMRQNAHDHDAGGLEGEPQEIDEIRRGIEDGGNQKPFIAHRAR